MSCKFETVVEELNKAINTPAIRNSKNEAVMALREWADRANEIVYSTYNIEYRGGGTHGVVPKKYYNTLNKLVRKILKPEVRTSDMLAFSKATAEVVSVVGGNSVGKRVTLSKKPKREALEAQAKGIWTNWYVEDSEYSTRYQRIGEDIIAEAFLEDEIFKSYVDKGTEIVAAQMLGEWAKVNGVHTLAHEIVHVGSVEYMKANPDSKLTKRVNELYGLAKQNKEQILKDMGEGRNEYWATSVYEFVAEGLSNPDMVYALSKLKTDSMPKYSNMLKELVISLLNIIGIDKDSNTYEYLLDGYIAMIEAQVRPDMSIRMSNVLDKMKKDMYAIKVAHRMDKEASIKGKSLDELKEMLSNTENGKEMLERLDGLKELCV